MAAGIELVGLTKRFHHGHAAAVDNIDLSVAGGEFFSLLGPSGCGKTTTLRLVAGFEEPTAGRILLDGVDVSGVPPHKRNVNTVFQSYALFPFMSVFDNVAFGLRYAGCSKAELKTRVGEALALVDMTSFSSRRPSQLSGGQQQRIALARALVLNPAALLLDEPLGALDAKLRRSLKVELKALQERVGITFIYVTHDQEEALTMSDRLAVMHAGRIAQIGTPREVYEEPTDSYVADFLGAANLIEISVVERTVGSTATLKLGDSVLTTSGAVPAAPGETAQAVIRPERIRVEEHGSAGGEPGAGDGRAGGLPGRGHPGHAPARDRGVAAGGHPQRRVGGDVGAGHPGALLPAGRRDPGAGACLPAGSTQAAESLAS